MSVATVELNMNLEQSGDYDLLAHEAERIVGEVLSQSLLHINEVSETSMNENIERGRLIELEYNDLEQRKPIKWPTNAEFTDEYVGLEKIQEYIEKEWKTISGAPDQCWLYATDFIERKALEFNDLYIYRVRYSIPTRRQPIPRQTVSIYFTLDVSKVKPKHLPIQVSFVFETMRLIHYPDKFRFRQNWLENIILLKEKLSTNIDF